MSANDPKRTCRRALQLPRRKANALAVIVALGKSAFEQGRKHAVLFDRTPVYATYYTSYVLRFGSKGTRLWKSRISIAFGSKLKQRLASGAALTWPHPGSALCEG
jgi:hypothetical protein